jgi:hypothetical protein
VVVYTIATLHCYFWIYLYYKVRCVFVCHYYDVQLSSPPVLKLWDTQVYLWLPYDRTEVIKLIKETFEPKNIFFSKETLCHSFRIIVIPFILLSFLPDYCHSFRITVTPSVLKLWDTQGYLWLPYDLVGVIKLIGETFAPKKNFMSFLPHDCHSFRISVIPSE